MPARIARACTAVLLTVIVFVAPGSSSAWADSVTDQKKSVDQQIAQLRVELEGASQDLVEAAVALKRAQLQLTDARAALARTQQARAAAVARDEELAGRLAFAEAELVKAERELATQQDAEAATRVSIGRIARETYAGNGLSGLSVALRATSPEEFNDQLLIARVALQAQGGTLDRLTVAQAEMRARNAKLEAIRAEIADLKRQSETVVAQRRQAEQDAARAEVTVSGLVAQERQQLTAVQSKVNAEKSRLAALEAEQGKLQAILAARARASDPVAKRRAATSPWRPPASSSFLAAAVSGPITSGFGMRYHPVLHYNRMHTGMDYGVGCGTPVHASADGEVISAGYAGGYGNRVVVDHGQIQGGDLATTYNHLSRIAVRSGTVRRGQVIAYVGTTGLSTGCHLHYETLLNGRYVNPLNYL